jgi:hypothetical protein
MNIGNDKLDDIVAENNVNDQDFQIFKIICNPIFEMLIIMAQTFMKCFSIIYDDTNSPLYELLEKK